MLACKSAPGGARESASCEGRRHPVSSFHPAYLPDLDEAQVGERNEFDKLAVDPAQQDQADNKDHGNPDQGWKCHGIQRLFAFKAERLPKRSRPTPRFIRAVLSTKAPQPSPSSSGLFIIGAIES